MTASLRFALGAKPPKIDPRTLQLARWRTTALAAPPTSVDWTTKIPEWPVFANDQYGDCTFAEAGHLTLAWSTNAGIGPVQLTTDDILRGYEALTGFNPGPPPTHDDGAYVLDVLNYWRTTGLGSGAGTHTIVAYAKVDAHDHTLIRQAVDAFGGVYSAFALPLSAQDQIRAGRAWRVTTGPRGEAGSWGGHATAILGYDRGGVELVTWGRRQRASWGWVRAYLTECYAVISPDFLDAVGKDPLGFDLAGLLGELHSL